MTLIVKICGLSTRQTLDVALEAGADMVGFVFFPPSPRHLGLEAARDLGRLVKRRASKVALTVDADDATLEGIVEALQPDILQLHGRETVSRVRDIKQKYKRLRPFQASKAVSTPANIAAATQGPTYPSGHSTFGAEVALLLSMMVPEKTAELHARGREYGEQRIASGVAYPSDFETAQIGATLMLALMMQKPEFRADFEATKLEIRKGLGLAP